MLIANTYSSDFIRRFVGDSLAESIKSASDLAKSGNYSDAIEAYLSIIDTDSANANAWYCLGVLYAQDNSLENAIEAFEKSDKIQPNHPPTGWNIHGSNLKFRQR